MPRTVGENPAQWQDWRYPGFTNGNFQVHFEEAGLEPAIVDHENIQIVFDLP